MPEKIKYNFGLSITGGPSDTFSGELNVDAYDKLSVTVSKGPSGTATANLQPLDGKVQLVYIKKPKIEDPAGKVTYKVDSGTDAIELDNNHILIGSSIIGKIGFFKTLTFTNTFPEDIVVEILVGRGSS